MKKRTSSPQQAEKKRTTEDLFIEVFEKSRQEIQNMTDKPLPWPYNAAHARDRSAEEAAQIVKLLTELLEISTDARVLRIAALGLASANLILRHLEGQGAQTRPT